MRNKRILSFLVALVSLLTLLPAASAANDVYVGQTFYFGSYEQDGNLRNGDEPILWRVYSVDYGSRTVRAVSEYGLDSMVYNRSTSTTSWHNSTIRSWLNSTFLSSAFTSAEQGQLNSVYVSNSSDYVYILSQWEIQQYLDTELLYATEYARQCGAYTASDTGTSSYWARVDSTSTFGVFVGAQVGSRRFFEPDRAVSRGEFVTMALACATNGRGGSLVSNIPMSGVSVAYLIEQCGGLADGVNAVNATGYDGWQAFPPMNLEASTYTENAYIALKYYGEDLSQDDGAPMTLVSLGNPGARQVKHIKSIDFTQDEAFFQGPMMAESDEPSPSYPINGMWFQEDGVTAKVGEPVTLTGAVYSWNRVVGDLASVNFSFDMGKTWQDVKIADQVTDFDPFQWVTYSLDWTPSKAGKYQVKLQATDVNGVQMKKPVTLFVNVEE